MNTPVDHTVLADIAQKLYRVASYGGAVTSRRSQGHDHAANQLTRGPLQYSLDDYHAALDKLAATQRTWVLDTLQTMIQAVESGDTWRANEEMCLTMIRVTDAEARALEERLDKVKAARDEWAKTAASYDIPRYRMGKVTGRNPSTVARWLE